MNILLHIGMSKCGSSSIQELLSSKDFYENKRKIMYIAITLNGTVLYGKKLIDIALSSPYKYVSTPDLNRFADMPYSVKQNIKQQIINIFNQYELDMIILSSEGWGSKGNLNVYIEDIFNHKEFNVDLISFIRPQVQWFNSAWWQWGAWADVSFEKWRDFTLPQIDWNAQLTDWVKALWINKVHVYLMGENVSSDFLNFIKLNNITAPKSNKSLPGNVLRLFQKYRELRPSPHSSEIEFILANRMEMPKGTTPWILSENEVNYIIKYFEQSNKDLMKFLDEKNKQVFNNDLSWHSVDYYKNKKTEKREIVELDNVILEELLVSSFKSIVKLNNHINKLEKNNIKENIPKCAKNLVNKLNEQGISL
jgi:hypothetical protein